MILLTTQHPLQFKQPDDPHSPYNLHRKPTNTTYYNANISLNYTATPGTEAIDTCWYNLNGTNNTLASCLNITLNLADGVYYVM